MPGFPAAGKGWREPKAATVRWRGRGAGPGGTRRNRGDAMAVKEFLRRLVGERPDGDGRAAGGAAPSPAPSASEDGDAADAATTALSRRHRPAGQAEAILREALAQKVLHAWAQNRHQTLFPLTLNLRSLDARAKALLVHAMAAAAAADGRVEEEERRRVAQALDRLGGGEEERRLAAAALERPMSLPVLLREVQAANLSAHAYAVSLLAVEQRDRVNRSYLGYLAARLALPEEVANSLARRYRG